MVQTNALPPESMSCEACPSPWVGDPLNVVDGNVRVSEVDASVAAPGIPLGFARYYNSFVDLEGGFGPKWTHTYSSSLASSNSVFDGGSTTWKVVSTPDGGLVSFEDNGDGTFKSPYNRDAVLTLTNGVYTATFGGLLDYTFSSNGVLQQIADHWGRSVTLSYTNGLLWKAEHSNGRALGFGHSSNRIASVSGPDSTLLASYAYTASGQLTNALLYAGGRTQSVSYAYAPQSHSMTQMLDRAGHVHAWTYQTNALGIATTRGASGLLAGQYLGVELSHDPVMTNRSVVAFDAGTSTYYKVYVHNPLSKKLLRVEGPAASASSIQHGIRIERDANENVVGRVQYDNAVAETFTTTMAYDDNHNVTNRGIGYCTDPVVFWRTEWDSALHLPLRETDPLGNETAYSYTNGLPVTVSVFPEAGQTSTTWIAYATNGLPVTTTNANGHWTRYSYTPEGDLSAVSNQAGDIAWFDTDSFGHVTNVTTPAATGTRSTAFTVDEEGKVGRITYPDGLHETMLYAGDGALTNHTDRAGRSTRYAYLPGGYLSAVTRMLGTNEATTTHVYNDQFTSLTIRDELDRAVEHYELDGQQRPWRITNVDGQTMTIDYGLGSFVRSVTRFDGSSLTNSYLPCGKLGYVTGPDGTDAFLRYANGLLRAASNGVTCVDYAYNGANWLTNATDSATSSSIVYAHDAAGNVTNTSWLGRNTRYTYDAGERMATLTAPGTAVSNAYHSYNGLLATRSETNSGITGAFGYDEIDQLSSITWTNSSGSTLLSFDYGRNAIGMVTNLVREDGSITTYGYDDLDRLTNVTRTVDGRIVYQRGYQYDLAGNRLAMTSPWWQVDYTTNHNRMVSWSLDLDGATIGAMDVHGHASETIGSPALYTNQSVTGAAAVTPAVDGTNFVAYAVPMGSGTQQVVAAIADAAGNIGMATSTVQIAVVTNATYGYTAAGCVSNITLRSASVTNTIDLAWDGHYRLTSVTTNGTVAESYQYNAHGLRVSTTDADGEKRWHVYSGNHQIAEVSTNGALLRSYTWGPGIDNLVSYSDYTESETNTYYALTDQLGTVHALADDSGAVVESYDYDAWGRILAVYNGEGIPQVSDLNRPTSSLGNNYLWQGRWYSWSTGFYYFRARWYDPVMGRWLSKDPIGISGGLNQYMFCGNNPGNERDPKGLTNQPGDFGWGNFTALAPVPFTPYADLPDYPSIGNAPASRRIECGSEMDLSEEEHLAAFFIMANLNPEFGYVPMGRRGRDMLLASQAMPLGAVGMAGLGVVGSGFSGPATVSACRWATTNPGKATAVAETIYGAFSDTPMGSKYEGIGQSLKLVWDKTQGRD